MKIEGQGEGGVHSELERRNGEQRCGCKSMGQHVKHSMKGLSVRENGNVLCVLVCAVFFRPLCVCVCCCVNEWFNVVYKPF